MNEQSNSVETSKWTKNVVIPFSTNARLPVKQTSVLSRALPCSSPGWVRLPLETWNTLELKNPATHLLKEPWW